MTQRVDPGPGRMDLAALAADGLWSGVRVLPIVLVLAIGVGLDALIKGEALSWRLAGVVAVFLLSIWPPVALLDMLARRVLRRWDVVPRALAFAPPLAAAVVGAPALTFGALYMHNQEGGLREMLGGFLAGLYIFAIAVPRYGMPLMPFAILLAALFLARRPAD